MKQKKKQISQFYGIPLFYLSVSYYSVVPNCRVEEGKKIYFGENFTMHFTLFGSIYTGLT